MRVLDASAVNGFHNPGIPTFVGEPGAARTQGTRIAEGARLRPRDAWLQGTDAPFELVCRYGCTLCVCALPCSAEHVANQAKHETAVTHILTNL